MTTFPIEDNIPVTRRYGPGKIPVAVYPLNQLEINQSFFVPDVTKEDIRRIRASITNYKKRELRKGNPVNFFSSATDGGIRIWRVDLDRPRIPRQNKT